MTTLKIDWDLKPGESLLEKIDTLNEKLRFIMGFLGMNKCNVSIYHTRRGEHVYVEFPDRLCAPNFIIALQSILGSDAWRELFNLKRVMDTAEGDSWNVLFSSKYKAGKRVSREELYTKYELRRDDGR